jgi:hypothetical protein
VAVIVAARKKVEDSKREYRACIPVVECWTGWFEVTQIYGLRAKAGIVEF